MEKIDWGQENILFVANELHQDIDLQETKKVRGIIEPWLTAVFQSEHLSLLLGAGLTTGVCVDAQVEPQAMQRLEFVTEQARIREHASQEAADLLRGSPNFEDDLRTAIELLKGLEILGDGRARLLEAEINEKLRTLICNLLRNEREVLSSSKRDESVLMLKRFLISFASRTATRDRLHIFTTNYDRFIEFALDSAGIYTLDRFVGKLNPTMRMHKMELDYHYNPPGIRGEPRYVEGVVRYTKLHGSLDWRFSDDEIHRDPLPFGGEITDETLATPFTTKVIYPNSSKGIDTAYFPYSELFRDFSSATCRPNSVLVSYGYGFGDSHINSIILDMMRIPSTHLVIISYDSASGRIERFVQKCNLSQLTLLVGKDLAGLRVLTESYLPKSAIDRISIRQLEILGRRGEKPRASHEVDTGNGEADD
ncbi:MAG: fibronectin-binding protein (FBP) [Spirochaetae bacterium HGW-Spirochaetae-10]|nr:MAG: fibronectin-binding protein (FBP) [Spirochaetae bacterium HGW-Spirochaetae-10]